MNKEHRVVDGVYPADSYRNVYFMLNNRVIPQDMNHCDHVTKISVYIYFLATRTTFFNEKFRGGIHSVMQERMPKFLASLILRHFILINQVHSVIQIFKCELHTEISWILIDFLTDNINYAT